MRPNVECWLCSFGNFRGYGPVLLKNSPLCIRVWDRTMYTRKTHFYVRIGFCTTLCVLSIAHEYIFNWRNILSWIPFGSDLNLNRFCKCKWREKERETGTCTSFRENQSASRDRQVERERERDRQREREKRERERERCVCFEFRHFFNSEISSTYFKVSCISLQKNLILSDCITL